MLRAVTEHVASCCTRSYAHPLEAALDGVRALMAATSAANGKAILALLRKGRPRQNEQCPVRGYRVAFYRRAIPLPPAVAKMAEEAMRAGLYVNDAVSMLTARKGQAYSVWLSRDSLSPTDNAAFWSTPLGEAMGERDVLRATVPLGPGGYALFCLDRTREQPRFDATDCERVAELLPALTEPMRRLGMYHGLVDGKVVMSPREVEVYRLLLAGHAEKDIAETLALTAHRAHELVSSIFNKLDVAGRAGLWQHWIACQHDAPQRARSRA